MGWERAAVAATVVAALFGACGGRGATRPGAVATSGAPTAATAGALPPLHIGPSGAAVAPSAPEAPVLAGEVSLRTPRAVPSGPVALAGCPQPPHRGSGGGGTTPWHPAVLVPDASLPPTPPPAPRTAGTSAVSGKGMWIWQYKATEHGDGAAVVARASRAGLRQLWVRVADSQDGFYGAATLADLVPRAHAAGIRVIGWGFPYLFDPAADARWTAQALAWRAPSGDALDGWSGDIETAGEGVALSPQRAALYLGLVRSALGGRPLVATVFPPVDRLWSGAYPFAAMAPYVDAFAPMVYWGCVEPGQAATSAIQRLSTLAPVHLVGQAYNMAEEGGRVGAPSGDEIARFLEVGRTAGATGASFWDWQEATGEEWDALSDYRWVAPAR